MRDADIDARRQAIINRLNRIEDEHILDSIEECLCYWEQENKLALLHVSSKSELCSMIDQVLEDDREGRMTDIENFYQEMDLWLKEE